MSKLMSKFQNEVNLCYEIHDLAMLLCINGVPQYSPIPANQELLHTLLKTLIVLMGMLLRHAKPITRLLQAYKNQTTEI